ncbi:PE-PPE domain-containing protein [Prescottella equi]|uniref:PE-PPE domain-containing protein n=1 Tax=Rhodococcus hoagii TaxID=43767 RepID=UPI001EEC2764|nr:PE-PPE domain-containing protein [Prescottella equi]
MPAIRSMLAISAVAASAIVLPLAATTPAAANPCPATIVIAVGGTSDPEARGMWPALDRYRREGADIRVVDYPASIWPVGRHLFDYSRAVGTPATIDAIRNAHHQCPGSQIVATGYSLGATIAGDALAQIAADGTVPADRVRGRLYADSRQAGGIETVLPTLIPGITMTGQRGSFGAIPVEQVCIQGDGVCDMPQPLQNPIGFVDSIAGYLTKHGGYGPNMSTPDGATGVTMIPAPPVNNWPQPILPGPALPQWPIPALPSPVVLPSFEDMNHAVNGFIRDVQALIPPLPQFPR